MKPVTRDGNRYRRPTLGALTSYLVLEGTDAWMRRHQKPGGAVLPEALPPRRLALLIAIGIGLHNLGEGLAIVTPLAKEPPGLGWLAALGLIAGAPAVAGALIGATVYQPALSAFLLGVGAGAVAQVAIKLLPLLKDHQGKTFTPLTNLGIVLGLAVMFVTGLLVQA